MNKEDCKLCNFLKRYLNSEEELDVVYESEYPLAIYQKEPHKFAEVHIMIFSKMHIPSIFEFAEDNNELVKDIWRAIKIASEAVFALKGGCKLEMYTGTFPTFEALKHFHCHVIYDSSVD